MRPRWQVVGGLGIFQILAWGSSFYLPAVLALPISAQTGWPLPWVIAGLTVGLLVSAVAAPHVGKAVAQRGGRPVLALGAGLLAMGLAMLGLAPGLPVFLAGWVVVGLGMSMALYDAAFATLGAIYGGKARSAITQLTLWGGFASTICWPLSAFLVEAGGWRMACLTYAALHLLVSLPLIWCFVPARPAAAGTPIAAPSSPPAAPLPGRPPAAAASALALPANRRERWLVAAIWVLLGLVSGAVSVHLMTLIQAQGASLATAVFIGTLIGPSQVAARLLEMANRERHHPVWTMRAATFLMVAGLALLTLGTGTTLLAVILYGAGNGLFSIARGTVPLALFGARNYPVVMGQLARPAQIALALAPTLGAAIVTSAGARATVLVLLALSILAFAAATFLRTGK